MPEPLRAAVIRKHTRLADVRVYPRLRSTSTRAAAFVEAGSLALPAAVIASRQSAGRGRHANTWWSDPGSLAVTFALPARPDESLLRIPLRAGLAVRACLAPHLPGHRLTVKWPNDVLVDGKKIAGVLCEHVRSTTLIGIGINVRTDLSRAPVPIRSRAVSLARLTTDPPTRTDLLVALYFALSDALSDDRWFEKFHQCDALRDKLVTADLGDHLLRGACLGITPDGRLRLHDGNQIHTLLAARIIAP